MASYVEAVLKPAGLENAEGLVSTPCAEDPFDPAWADEAKFKRFFGLGEDEPNRGNPRDSGVVLGYTASFLAGSVGAAIG